METEALTRQGWKRRADLRVGDEILTLNPETDAIGWQQIESLSDFDYDGPLVRWDNRIDALTTPNHRWLVESRYGRKREFIREIARTSKATDGDKAVSELTQGSRIITGGGTPLEFATEAKWSDELVETVGWYLTEGADIFASSGWHSATISQKKPQFVTDIRRLAEYWKQQGATFTEAKKLRDSGVVTWYLGKGVANALREAAPGKKLTPEFLTSLTYHQAQLLRKVLIDGDGTRSGSRVTWYQDDAGRKDGYQMLCAMLGIRTRQDDHIVCEYQARHILAEETARRAVEEYPEILEVWCPTVANGIWFARRNGSTYWTGNTAPVTVITGAKASNLEHASPGEPSRPVGLE